MALPATDNFNRANGELAAGNSSWTRHTGGGNAAVSSNAISPATSGNNAYYYWNADAFQGDHYAQLTITNLTTNGGFGPMVRIQSGQPSGYGMEIFPGAGAARLYRFDNGGATQLATYTATAGETWRLEAEGSTIRVKKNGVTQGEITDATHTGGAAGLFTFDFDDTALGDDWEGSNLSDPQKTYPNADISNAGSWTTQPPIFSNGFETGNLTEWTGSTVQGTSSITATASGAQEGTYRAAVVANITDGQGCFVYEDASEPSSQLSIADFWLKRVSITSMGLTDVPGGKYVAAVWGYDEFSNLTPWTWLAIQDTSGVLRPAYRATVDGATAYIGSTTNTMPTAWRKYRCVIDRVNKTIEWLYSDDGTSFTSISTVTDTSTASNRFMNRSGSGISRISAGIGHSVNWMSMVASIDVDTVSFMGATPSSSLYQSVDEETANDTDYAISPSAPANAVAVLGFPAMGVPTVNTGHSLLVRRRRTGGGSGKNVNLTTRLLQGGTQIASFTDDSIPSSYTTVTHAVAEADAANITDYSQLRVELSANQPSGQTAGAPSYQGISSATATSTSGNFTITYTVTPQVDDIIIALVAAKDNVACTFPAGWTVKDATNNGATIRATVAWKRYAAGDTDTSVLVTHTGGSRTRGRTIVVRGAPTSGDPFNVFAVNTGSGSPTTYPAITTTVDNCRIFYFAANAANTAHAVPGGTNPTYAEVWDDGTNTTSTIRNAAGHGTQTVAATIASRTGTSGTGVWVSYTFAIGPVTLADAQAEVSWIEFQTPLPAAFTKTVPVEGVVASSSTPVTLTVGVTTVTKGAFTSTVGVTTVAKGTFIQTLGVNTLVRGTYTHTIPVTTVSKGTFGNTVPVSTLTKGSFSASASVSTVISGTFIGTVPVSALIRGTFTKTVSVTSVVGTATTPTLGPATSYGQNTTLGNDLGPDGVSWAQGYPIVVDQYGKIVLLEQRHNGGGLCYIYSNDNGQTWSDNTGNTSNGQNSPYEAFIVRAGIAYDSANDMIHALHSASSGADGIIYRRYIISRDGSNNITAINRDYADSINMQLEYDANIVTEKPILLWLNDAAYGSHGALVAIWEVTDAGEGEIHAAMRVLTNTSADGVAANWTRLDGGTSSDTSDITSTKAVPITVMTPSYTNQLVPAVIRKRSGTHQKDLYLFWHVRGNSALYWRRFPWDSTNNNWDAPTTAASISNTVRAGTRTDIASTQLWEVLSKPAEDTVNDRVYIGFANWKNNTDGDTWSFAHVDSSDAISSVTDVYSCGGIFAPSPYALAGDIAWDGGTQTLAVTYIKSGTGAQDGFIRLYDSSGAAVTAEFEFFNSADVDIPCLYQDPNNGNTRIDSNKLLSVFRDTSDLAPPYDGWASLITITAGASGGTLTVPVSGLTIGTFAHAVGVTTVTQGTFAASAAVSAVTEGTFGASASVSGLVRGTYTNTVGVTAATRGTYLHAVPINAQVVSINTHTLGVTSVMRGTFIRSVGVSTVAKGAFAATVAVSAIVKGAFAASAPVSSLVEGTFSVATPVSGQVVATRAVIVPVSTTVRGTYAHSIGVTALVEQEHELAVPVSTLVRGIYTHTIPVTAIARGTYTNEVPVTAVTKGSFTSVIPVNGLVGSGVTHTVDVTSLVRGIWTKTVGVSSIVVEQYTKTVPTSTVTEATFAHSIGTSTLIRGTYTHAIGMSAVTEATFTLAIPASATVEGTFVRTVSVNAQVIASVSKNVPVSTLITLSGTHAIPVSSITEATYTHAIPVSTFIQGEGQALTIGITGLLRGTFAHAIGVSTAIQASAVLTVGVATVVEATFTRTVGIASEVKGTFVASVGVTTVVDGQFVASVPVSSLVRGTFSHVVGVSAVTYTTSKHTIAVTSSINQQLRHIIPIATVTNGVFRLAVPVTGLIEGNTLFISTRIVLIGPRPVIHGYVRKAVDGGGVIRGVVGGGEIETVLRGSGQVKAG